MESQKQELPLGVYELLKTDEVLSYRTPEGASWEEEELTADDPLHLASLVRYLAEKISRRLEQADSRERVAIVNELLSHLQGETGRDSVYEDPDKKNRGNLYQLTELKPTSEAKPRSRPSTPLAEVALLTNNPKEPRLGTELARELESADRVDLLCSFLKVSGINVLRPQLEVIRRRRVPFRVITTTYMGATERKAVDCLVREYGAQVKVSYEKNSTRLHAKAWLFHRDSGFTTGYIGSSNLSHSALTEGLEWNVRMSNTVTPGIIDRFKATFTAYWESRQFETYTGTTDDQEKLDQALEQAAIGRGARKRPQIDINFSHVDVEPRPHQAAMLDELQAERLKGHHRNLAVAATGTGKTILSALDYRRLCQEAGRSLRLLFIAHQAEILNQSRYAFITVMRDSGFGEEYYDGQVPQQNKHVFATIQTLSQGGYERFTPEHFDMIVIDEFHHAAAPSYRKVIEYFTPKELLGLTATPERSDGTNVAAEFFEGRIATELRLWEALEDTDLLVPFHYYGIDDATDLSGISFYRGQYRDSELSRYYIENKRRVALILEQINQKIAYPQEMRAIGFCVDRAHAKYMADQFNRANLEAAYLTGEDSQERRREIISRLKDPNDGLTTIFTVNLFNEGVDIPEVDTLLMLRPTQSPTLFQQQLGRGLRRSPDKAVLIVLDFVGNQAKGFRFDQKMRALSRNGVLTEKDVREPSLPLGCSIQLDQRTQSQVLRSIKDALSPKIDVLVSNLKVFAEDYRKKNFEVVETELLEPYLEHFGMELAHIYGRKVKGGKGLTFTFLLEQSGQIPRIPALQERGSMTEHLLNRIKALSHVNDGTRVDIYQRLLTEDIFEEQLSPLEQRYAWMLLFSCWPNGKFRQGEQKFTLNQGLSELRQHPYFIQELIQIWSYRLNVDRHAPLPAPNLDPNIPLKTHAYYSREEIFAALGGHESEKAAAPGAWVSGVYEFHQTEAIALLVTLNKSEKHYSPETMYKDYAVTESEFAWDSQNNTAPDSRLGCLYQEHATLGKVPLMFVRYNKTDAIGTSPYLFVGAVSYRSHTGSKPMHIKWSLERALPADLYAVARATA